MNANARRSGTGSNMRSWPNLLILLMVATALLGAPQVAALAGDPVIKNGAVESIRIGDSVEKVFATFGSRFQLKDLRPANAVRTVTLLRGSEKVITFSIGPDNRIVLIDIFSDYVTEEGLGKGSALSQALRAYGEAMLTPTDQGYLLTFKKFSGVGFLLNNKDIPKKLRDIPDDTFTPNHEKKILALGAIKIVSIQMFASD